jgi:hypothetical protein
MESTNSSFSRANLAKLYRHISLISRYLFAVATHFGFISGLGSYYLAWGFLVAFVLIMTEILVAMQARRF